MQTSPLGTVELLLRLRWLLRSRSSSTLPFHPDLVADECRAGARRHPRALMTSNNPDVKTLAPLVLVVDDDRDTRDMYALFLELSGYRVVAAPDASSALEIALAQEPQVVITDFMLPGGVSGADLCRNLKQHERTAHVPALLVTGSSRRSDAELALGAGCADIRVKPYLPDALLHDVQSLTSASSGPVLSTSAS
jgi:CheY-like chemotaxis protein